MPAAGDAVSTEPPAPAPRRRRLLFVLNDLPFFVSHRLPVALAAMRRGYDVHVAAPDHPVAASLRERGLRLHQLPLTRAGMHPLDEARTLGALMRLYRALRPDLVHHVTAKPVLYGSLAARLAGVPAVVNAVSGLGFVFMSQGALASVRRWIVRRGYRAAFGHRNSRVILQNPEDRDAFIAGGLLRAEQAVLIRGSGVDTRAIQPAPEPTGTPVVLLPARMLRDKGVVEFVEAARRMRGRARFVLAGGIDANPTAISEAEIASWVRDGVVEYHGYVDDMTKLLASATLVCLPSYREGLPKSLLDAMAAGRAIVTTDVPGCREAVRDGDNGLLVPARDPVALAAAIARLLNDPEARRAMGRRGRARAETEFSLDGVIAETLATYELLLQREPGA